MPLVLAIVAAILIAMLVLAIWPILLGLGVIVAVILAALMVLIVPATIVYVTLFPSAEEKKRREDMRKRQQEARELGWQPWTPRDRDQ